MAVSYTSLTALIQNYTENTEPSFVSYIPTFIQLAEQRIYNAVQIPALRKNQIGTTTASNKYLTVPTDWLATFALAVIDPVTAEQTYLLNKDVEYIREAFPFPAVTGKPSHYGQFDVDTIIIGPTPDASYQVELHYYYYPESIVTAGVSWLGNNFDSVLIYGTLREAYTYMKGDQDLATMYEAKYLEALELLKVLGEGKDRRDAYRSGQSRISF